MRKRTLVPRTFLLGLAIVGAAGCHDRAPATPVAISIPPVRNLIPRTTVVNTPVQDDSRTPARSALIDLLHSNAGQAVFPVGTRLRTVKLSEGVATVDFSHEFNGLVTMGDSAESQVQHLLCETLAGVPGVLKMRVTVEGKRFESEATDWNTPFAVRTEQGLRGSNSNRSGSSEEH